MSEQKEQLRLNFKYLTHHSTELLPIAKNTDVTLDTQYLLKKVKAFLSQHRLSVTHYLTIWIESKGIRQNLFKLRKKNTGITLTPDKGLFQLNVIIEQGQQQINPILHFQHQQDSYTRLKNNITRAIEQGQQKQQQQNSGNSRPIDIAYFFADPLIKMHVKSGTKLEIVPTQSEVSYQVQYDQFIDIVQKEEFRRNFRIEMMAATETNIKNTLIEGTSILHFSCHGDEMQQLHIEHEKRIGELVKLKNNTFMDLLTSGTLPRVVIFNVCYSYELAKKVSAEKGIVTIGYKGKAHDKVCEKFTKSFYIGLFRDNKSIRQLFHEVKAMISQEKPEEGEKLHIFPEEDDNKSTIIEEPVESNLQFRKRWRVLQSLRENDCLGVKQEMYKIIKTLINEQRMNCIFLEGGKDSGKTNLMQKIRIYTINRKLFTDDLMLNLRVHGHRLETMLALRLTVQRQILAFRNQIQSKQRLSQQGMINSLIIIDHAEKLLRYQYSQLRRYIQKQLKDRLRYGEIVIVCRKDQPLCKQSKIQYAHENRILKEEKDIENSKQFDFFIQRYYSLEFLQKLRQLKKEKNCKFIQLIKAVKRSRTQQISDIQKQLDKISYKYEPRLIEIQLEKELDTLEESLREFLKDVNIEVAEHHHLYLSTILQDIVLKEHVHSRDRLNSSSSGKDSKDGSILQLVKSFKLMFKQAIIRQPNEVIYSFKRIAKLSFDIAGLCYLSKCHLQAHLLNCQVLYVMASVCMVTPQLKLNKTNSHTEQQDLNGSAIQDIDFEEKMERWIKCYRMKVLLTLYTYYTERQHELQVKERSRQKKEGGLVENPQQYHGKAEIVLDQLYHFVQKRSTNQKQMETKSTFLKKYQEINHFVQHLKFSSQENPLKVSQQRDMDDDISIQQINKVHEEINNYWLLYQQLVSANRPTQQNGESILTKDSEVILTLIAIKLIKPNQKLLALLKSQTSSLNRQIQGYVDLYIKIMQHIMDSPIFIRDKRNKLLMGESRLSKMDDSRTKMDQPRLKIPQSRLRMEQTRSVKIEESRRSLQEKAQQNGYIAWNYPQVASIKPIFKNYYKQFVRVYFQLSKLSQAFSKNFSIKIFNELLALCDHPKMKMVSQKKAIQMHKQTQFLNNYSCQTYIALPLLDSEEDYKFQKGKRVNIKRYERHVNRFQQTFFNNLEREIKHQIFVLNRQFFTKARHNSKCLVQLLMVNCTQDVIECQSKLATTQVIKINDISKVPLAPVIILFGVNVKYLVNTLRQKCKGSFIISINLKEIDSSSQIQLERVAQKGIKDERSKKVEKEIRLKRLQEYSMRQAMAYSILEYFYTSFCKHFFMVQYTLFQEQVRSSYHFALAQTFLKMKINFEKLHDATSYFDFVDDTLKQIQLSTSVETDHLLRSKLAYHFMVKGRIEDQLMKCIGGIAESKQNQRDGKKERQRQGRYQGIQTEIGCNNEIVQLLTQMYDHRNIKINVVVLYKSQQMLELFKQTFTYKIQKYREYELQEQFKVPQWQDMNRTSVASLPNFLPNKKSKSYETDSVETYKPKIEMYDNIEEDEFRSLIQEKEEKGIKQLGVRLFFTQKIYKCSNANTFEIALEERFNSQRWLFELYFLDCLKQRPLVPLETLKKILGKYQGTSLRDIRQGVKAAKDKKHP